MISAPASPDNSCRGFLFKPGVYAPSKLAVSLVLSAALHGLMFFWLPASGIPGGDSKHTRPLTSHPMGGALTLNVRLQAPKRVEVVPLPVEEPSAEQARSTNEAAISPDTSVAVTPQKESTGLLSGYYSLKSLSRLPEPLTAFNPELPDSQDAQLTGHIELRLWLSNTGKIDRIELLNAEHQLPEELTKLVQESFQKIRFRPGEIGGLPVPSWSDIVIELKPEADPFEPPMPIPAIPSAAGNSHPLPRP